MTQGAFKVLLIADSTIDPLARFITQGRPDIAVSVAPYDQVVSNLAGEISGVDLVVVFTQPDRVSSEFAKALQYEPFDRGHAIEEFGAFADLLARAADKVPAMAAFTWSMPFWAVPDALRSWQGPYDVSRLLAGANLKLATAAETSRNMVVLEQAACLAGAAAFDPKLWAMGKVIHPRPALEAFARQIRSLIDSLQGRSRKLIVLDLDNTLWGGTVGDDGWQNLRLGGIDPIGESYSLFQRQLKVLRRRGVLLGLVSKNEELVALEAIRSHPEMVLKMEDFVGWRINWQDKAANIADLVTELNLGPQSVVFIDDNPAERDRVRQALPEVLVPEWPADPAMYPLALKNLGCFETLQLSDEDRQRTAMYQQERQRTHTMGAVGSRADWLKSLGMKVLIRRLEPANLARAAQLLNKTNQFNLSTRRLSEAQLADWAAQPGQGCLVFDAEDRFGGYGLVGLLSLCVQPEDKSLRIVDWVVSCRVLGRGLEETMLAAAGHWAHKAGCGRIVATYQPTVKNKPILSFLEGLPAAERRGDEFVVIPDNCSRVGHVIVSDESEKEGSASVVDADR
jgi:FkbH-like protein